MAARVGVLWENTAKSGITYYSGTISIGIFGEIPIVIFENKHKKEGSTEPDFHIMKADKSKRAQQVNTSDEDAQWEQHIRGSVNSLKDDIEPY